MGGSDMTEQKQQQPEEVAETPEGVVELSGDELDGVVGGVAVPGQGGVRPGTPGQPQGIIAILIGL